MELLLQSECLQGRGREERGGEGRGGKGRGGGKGGAKGSRFGLVASLGVMVSHAWEYIDSPAHSVSGVLLDDALLLHVLT